ncbi:MAG TPA: hypothetical protein VI612_04505 [Candidatus Nanoarchaeia archaeon]|nr:hypothetical protein [Candidatus Nanoarchaeia archaeon]
MIKKFLSKAAGSVLAIAALASQARAQGYEHSSSEQSSETRTTDLSQEDHTRRESRGPLQAYLGTLGYATPTNWGVEANGRVSLRLGSDRVLSRLRANLYANSAFEQTSVESAPDLTTESLEGGLGIGINLGRTRQVYIEPIVFAEAQKYLDNVELDANIVRVGLRFSTILPTRTRVTLEGLTDVFGEYDGNLSNGLPVEGDVTRHSARASIAQVLARNQKGAWLYATADGKIERFDFDGLRDYTSASVRAGLDFVIKTAGQEFHVMPSVRHTWQNTEYPLTDTESRRQITKPELAIQWRPSDKVSLSASVGYQTGDVEKGVTGSASIRYDIK